MKKLVIVIIFILGVVQSQAREMGHYMPGVASIRDFAVPTVPGFYYAQYHTYYATNKYKDRNGNSVDSLNTNNGTVNINTSYDMFAISPYFLYVTKEKFLGGTYAFSVQPTILTSNISSNISNTNNNISQETRNSGLGDLFVQPLFLGWQQEMAESSLGIGFYLPIGEYEAGANDNLGLGFWTTQIQASQYFYLDEQQASAIQLTGTYEIHTNKEGVDIRPGDHFTLEYGYSQYLNNKFSMGVSGYSLWQVSDDKGNDLSMSPQKSQVHALGLEFAYWFTGKTNITFKYSKEYNAKSRFEGDVFTINLLTLPF